LWSVARRAIWLAAGIVAGIWLIFSLSNVLMLVLISLILATGLRPMVEWLYALRVPRPVAVLLIYLLFIVVLVGLGFLIVPTLSAGVGAIVGGAPALAATLQADLQALEQQNSFLAPVLGPLTKQLPSLATQLGAIAGQLLGVAAFALTAASGLLNIVLILLLTFYLVTDGPRIQEYALSFVPSSQRERARRVTSAMGRRMGGWLLGQIVVSTVVGVVTYVVLFFLGVPGALILAVVAAIAVVVPIIGPFLALVPPVLVALTQSPLLALITFIILFVFQQVEMNVLGPLIFNRTVKIHPAAVLLALLIGGALLGAVGALIAVPVAAAISVALDEWRDTNTTRLVTGKVAKATEVTSRDDSTEEVSSATAARAPS
jgi:predicted PurR-regulated permease PerM